MEEELLPISGLQHLVFCPRQCAFIHVERLWVENQLTAEGRVLHSRQDEPGYETRHGVKLRRSVRVYSHDLRIWGICDMVEFEKTSDGLRITPVETKRGKPKKDISDAVQLCAQALCLEEMYRVEIRAAFLFYATTRRRLEVAIDDSLRQQTLDLILQFREMIETRKTPSPEPSAKCRNCSFIEICKPEEISKRSASRYLTSLYRSI